MTDVHLDQTIQWTADANAVRYQLKIAAPGESPVGTHIAAIIDHREIDGATPNSIPASALLDAPGIENGGEYEIFIRGASGAGFGPWSDALKIVAHKTNVSKVVDLTIV